jgi:GDP-L-fucose synthase
MKRVIDKKILICGATGFIGANILQRLTSKFVSIRAVYHVKKPKYRSKNIEWVKADLTDSKDVRKIMKGIDVVFQYAAVTSGVKDIVNSPPHIHITDNVIMNSILMKEAYNQKVEHFIFPSCTIMYQSSSKKIKESDFDASIDIHPKYYGPGNTKVYLEKMCKFYSSKGETKFTVLRQSNVYGPGDKFDLDIGHVFAATIVKVENAKSDINVWGTGEEERDLIHVSDLLNLLELIVEKQTLKFQLINVGIGKSVSISDLVHKIVSASQKKLKVKYDKDKPTINTKIALDITRAKNLFGWEPLISLEEGIEKTIEWYRRTK